MKMRRFPGARRLRQAGRWLRSRWTPHAVILGYHRVGDPAHDPLGLTVTAEELDTHLELLARRARPVTLQEIVAGYAYGGPHPRSVAVTFDDGYLDTLQLALPLLERHGVPATVFCTTGSPGAAFWWDSLVTWVATAARMPTPFTVEVGNRRHTLDTGDRRRFVLRLAGLLQPLTPAARGELMTHLAARLEPREPVGAVRALTHDELRQLGAHPLVEVGGHSVTHSELPRLAVEEQREEIGANVRLLEGLVGAPVRFFSYPHGAYAPATQRLLQESGIAAACGSDPDVTTASSDQFALPRLWADGARQEGFARWINRWLG